MYDITQETPYDFANVEQLRRPSSCRPNRRGTKPPLFQVNHWIESYPPRPANANIVNQKDFIVRRVRECERIRDRTANIVAVDFVSRGDLIGAVDELNGVSQTPAGTVSGTPATP